MSVPTPIHKDMAEQVLLGAMLQDSETLDKVISQLSEEDFYQPTNQTIFHNIKELASDNNRVDAQMLSSHMMDNGQLEQVGGIDYIAQLVGSAPTSNNSDYFIKQIRDAAILRHINVVGQQLQQMSNVSDASAEDVLSKSLEAAFSLEDSSRSEDDELKTAYRLSDEMLQQLDEMSQNPNEFGTPTGFRDIDALTHGLQAGQMVIVAGRPGMGKSTLGMDFARNAALHKGLPTVIFSLEMGGHELMQRMFAAETGIRLASFQHPENLNSNDWNKLNALCHQVEKAPLWVDDSAIINMSTIRAKCRALSRKVNGLKLIVIDYLQLMSSGKTVENRQQEVSNFSRQCKMLAKELQCPVVVLSQLNRNAEQRADKRPELSDLRESGSIEQDADMVFLVHRPEYYDREERPGEADVILAKHRNGPTETFNLAFMGECSKFADMAAGFENEF